MTFHVTIALEDQAKAELDAWAAAKGVPVARLLIDAVDVYVAENRSLADTRTRGRAAAAAGDVHDHADVLAEFADRRAAWRLRA